MRSVGRRSLDTSAVGANRLLGKLVASERAGSDTLLEGESCRTISSISSESTEPTESPSRCALSFRLCFVPAPPSSSSSSSSSSMQLRSIVEWVAVLVHAGVME